jgi:hypothetical protein
LTSSADFVSLAKNRLAQAQISGARLFFYKMVVRVHTYTLGVYILYGWPLNAGDTTNTIEKQQNWHLYKFNKH